MKRLFIAVGASILMLIPLISFLVMWEVFTFPNSHRWSGYVVAGYLVLIMACLTWEIVRDAWRWLTRR